MQITSSRRFVIHSRQGPDSSTITNPLIIYPTASVQLPRLQVSAHQMPDLNVPTVTQEHIDAFHRKHFSPEAVDAFFGRFRQHAQQQPPSTDVNHHENEEEDDGLGYYPDGAKRTLTDEQIAIFRHSEEEALRRVERKKLEEAKKRLEEKLLSGFNEASNGDAVEEENVEMEEGVIEEEVKEAKSIGRVDPASGKTFMWPAISSE